MNYKTLGQIAFDAYVAKKGNIAYDGTAIPAWEALAPGVVPAWEAAAKAIEDEVLFREGYKKAFLPTDGRSA